MNIICGIRTPRSPAFRMRTLLLFNNNINGAVSGEKYNISGDIFVLVGILPF